MICDMFFNEIIENNDPHVLSTVMDTDGVTARENDSVEWKTSISRSGSSLGKIHALAALRILNLAEYTVGNQKTIQL